MGMFDRFKTKKGEEKISMPAKATSDEAVAKDAKVAKTEKKPKAVKEKKAAKAISLELQGVVVRPLVTEKAAHLASTGQYAFLVHPNANRVQVRAAVKAMYGITPDSVNIQVVRGKAVRFGRFSGARKTWKKAIVTLPKGKTIDVYEGV